MIDGFPRTAIQVDFVKLLHDKLMALSLLHADSPEEWRYPRPSFKVLAGSAPRARGLGWVQRGGGQRCLANGLPLTLSLAFHLSWGVRRCGVAAARHVHQPCTRLPCP